MRWLKVSLFCLCFCFNSLLTQLVAAGGATADTTHKKYHSSSSSSSSSTPATVGRILLSRFYSRKSQSLNQNQHNHNSHSHHHNNNNNNNNHHHQHHHQQQHQHQQQQKQQQRQQQQHHQQYHPPQQRPASARQYQGDESTGGGKGSTKLRPQFHNVKGRPGKSTEKIGAKRRRRDEIYGERHQLTDRQTPSASAPQGHAHHSSKDSKHNKHSTSSNKLNKNHHHHHHQQQQQQQQQQHHHHHSNNKNKNNSSKTNHHHNTKHININKNKHKTHSNSSSSSNSSININNDDNDSSDHHHHHQQQKQQKHIKHKDNGTDIRIKCPKCQQRDNEMQLRLALIKDNILKYLGLSSVPNIKDPSIPQIPTVQHAINEHAMQKDSPFHTGRKLDFDNEFVGHTLRPLQRIMVSYPLTNFSFPNLTNTFQFSLKLLPYMYSIKKAILWLYLRPVLTSAEEGFTVLEVNCLSTNKSLRARKVKLERNSEGKGKWYTFDTTKIVKKRLIAKEGHIQMQAMAHSKQGTNQLVLLSDNQEDRGYKPYLEIQMVPNRRKRSKRGVGLQCDATKVENRCCLYPMEVTFADFGWNWIIIPSTYRANYCSGECDIKLLQDYAHTSMVSNLKQNSSQIICCTPTALSSLSLLYFNDDADIEQRDLPNMIVDSCGCR